jgi:hypothetical protein
MPGDFPRARRWLICALLAAATVAVYWGVHRFEFTNYDDWEVALKNPVVHQGLTAESVTWAFTTHYYDYWHPLAWLSHMLDVQLFGLNAGLHHVTSLFIHVLNVWLVFLVFARMTGSWERSAFLAALFALHPLNVDSVAWIAERKNVLSTTFWLLTVWAYARFAARPAMGRYLLTLALFALGLMAKPMLITLPFVFLLLDYWPLQRLELPFLRGSDIEIRTDVASPIRIPQFSASPPARKAPVPRLGSSLCCNHLRHRQRQGLRRFHRQVPDGGPAAQRSGRLCRLPLENDLAGETRRLLPASGALAAVEGRWRQPHLALPLAGGAHPVSATSLSSRGVALVFRHTGAGHRHHPDRRSIHRGPLGLRAATGVLRGPGVGRG